ncbi:MAG TPA: hypothetical protein VNK48_15680 [Xanthobacteraceae bacterium]|nr:hypothetical protein [Xanthobacteraceae bacterium]
MQRTGVSRRLAGVMVAGFALAACSTMGGDSPFGQLPTFPGLGPAAPSETPPRYTAEEIVGRWGVASYHRDLDRTRTEAAARRQCSKAYTISKGPNGGVMMHLADQPTPVELRIKTAPDGKTFIGPAGEPGGAQDREIVSFDGRVMILRYTDPEVAGRYGTTIYVRCGPTAA